LAKIETVSYFTYTKTGNTAIACRRQRHTDIVNYTNKQCQ